LSPASHRGNPVSIPGQPTWDLWWTKWHWDSFPSNRLLRSGEWQNFWTQLPPAVWTGCWNADHKTGPTTPNSQWQGA
jgi:hypothetical protein